MADADVYYCEPRSEAGTGNARKDRREGWIPGVLYGGGEDPVAIRLKASEINKAFQHGKLRPQLARIDVPGEDGQQPVIPRDVQLHPVKGIPIHVDLMRVSEKTRIDVEVAVHFTNEEESPGLKRGGVLNVVRHGVEIIAPATSIPDYFEIDISSMDIGDAVHASALDLPEGVTLVTTDRDFTIATIAAPSAVRSAGDDEDEDAEGTGEEADEAETADEENKEEGAE